MGAAQRGGGGEARQEAGLGEERAKAARIVATRGQRWGVSRASTPRPMPAGVLALVQPPDRFSFPSGHAASSLSVALALAGAAGGPLAAALAALALVLGLSRCYLGVHSGAGPRRRTSCSSSGEFIRSGKRALRCSSRGSNRL